MNIMDRAKELAQQAIDKAGPSAAKGVDAASSQLDKVTGGKYHDQIENVSNKVTGVLDPNKEKGEGDGTTGSGGPSGGNESA